MNKRKKAAGLAILGAPAARRNNIYISNLFALGGLPNFGDTINADDPEEIARHEAELKEAIKPDVKKTKGEPLDKAGSVITGIAELGSQVADNLKVEKPDVSGPEGWSRQSLADYSANTNISLGRSSVAGAGLSGLASGAAAGSAFGPIGTAVGGAVGMLGGAVSALVGNDKRRKEERKANAAIANRVNAMNSAINQDAANAWITNNAAYGGQFSTGLDKIEKGGSHEQNPLGGIPVSIDENGNPNMVEEGEARWKNYIFSNRLDVPKNKDLLSILGLPSTYGGKPFSKAAATAGKEAKERENDPISKRGLQDALGKLQALQELVRPRQQQTPVKAGGGAEYLKYAPVAQNAIAGISALFDRPDRLHLNRMAAPVVNERMVYNPVDTEYATGAIRQQAAAANRQAYDLSGANPGIAGLMTMYNNRQAGNSIANARLQGRMYNDRLRGQATQFNAGMAQFNARNEMEARLANIQQSNAEKEYYKKSLAARNNAVRSSFAALADALGKIGVERQHEKTAVNTTGYTHTGEYKKP
jgi:hypothetical protein